jgi:NarL family two-component system response regulator LiaR
MHISVLLADDQPAIRQGLRLRLGLEPDIDVIGEAADGIAAVALATRLRPQVVVMDVGMPSLDGIEATRELQLRVPGSAVVILSLHDDANTRHRARQAGATAFVAKHEADHSLIDAIRQAATRTSDGDTPKGGQPP